MSLQSAVKLYVTVSRNYQLGCKNGETRSFGKKNGSLFSLAVFHEGSVMSTHPVHPSTSATIQRKSSDQMEPTTFGKMKTKDKNGNNQTKGFRKTWLVNGHVTHVPT